MIDGLKPYRSYKPAEMCWLGQIPDHWAEKRAKHFFREVDERSSTGQEELMSVSHVTGVTRRKQNVTMFMAESNVGHKICRPCDLVINTMWAFMAALGVAKQTGTVSPSYGVYRPLHSGDLLPEYVDRLLRIEEYKSEYLCRSTGIHSSRLRLYPEQFLRILMLCPPAAEQAAIVRFVDHADRRIRRYISAKRRLIALLNEQKQALIHRAVTRGLAPDVFLNSSGANSPPNIPKGWKIRRLKTLLHRIEQGISPQAEARLAADGAWGVLKSGCVNHGVFRETEHKRLPDGFSFDEELAVRNGDVLVSRACGSPTLVGSVGRVPELKYRLILSDKTFRLVFKDPMLIDFAVAAMNSRYFRRQVEQAISGAEGLANNLPLSSLRDFLLLIPSPSVAQEIAATLSLRLAELTSLIHRLEREVELILEYRTRLIADVVTGKLDVRDTAARLPDEIEEPEPVDEQLLEGEEGVDDAELDAEPEEVEA